MFNRRKLLSFLPGFIAAPLLARNSLKTNDLYDEASTLAKLDEKHLYLNRDILSSLRCSRLNLQARDIESTLEDPLYHVKLSAEDKKLLMEALDNKPSRKITWCGNYGPYETYPKSDDVMVVIAGCGISNWIERTSKIYGKGKDGNIICEDLTYIPTSPRNRKP